MLLLKIFFKHLLQNIKQKLPAMEAQYKMVTRTAQLVTKEVSQEEVHEMLATLTRIKEQISKVAEYIFLLYMVLTAELLTSKLHEKKERNKQKNTQGYAFEQMNVCSNIGVN